MESATHRPAAGAGHHEAGHSTGASPRHPAPISALARLPTACGLRCGVPAPQPPPARADGLRTGHLGGTTRRLGGQPGVMRQIVTWPERQLQPGLELEERDRPMLELPTDD